MKRKDKESSPCGLCGKETRRCVTIKKKKVFVCLTCRPFWCG